MRYLLFILFVFFSLLAQAQVDLITGLVGKYCLDGDGYDHSPNQNHGTLYNASATTDRFGNPNSAISFTGSVSYMNIPNKGIFNNQYTYSFWYNVAQNPAYNQARFMLHVGGTQCDQSVNISNNYFGVYNGINAGGYYHASTGSTYNAEYSTLPPINQWNHVASVKTADSIKLYINGKLVSSSPAPQNPCYQGNDLGAKLAGRAGHNQYFAGKMDDAWIFNRALSDEEIEAIFEYDGQLNFSLGNDTTLCGNQQLVLDPGITGATYFWSDSSTGPTLKVRKPGIYWVRVNQYCVNKTDTIVVDWSGYGEISPAVTICPGDSALFSVSGLKGAVSQWSFTGSAGNTAYAMDSGMIWVRISQNNCHYYDSTYLYYDSCNVDLLAGLVGKYCLDGDGFDHSPNQNHGTLYNASATTDRFGIVNGAVSFTGSNSYMQIPDKGLQNNQYTYSFWYNVTQNPANGQARFMFDAGGGTCDQFVFIANNYLSSYYGITAGGYHSPTGNISTSYNILPPLNQWNHIASVKTSDSIKLYVNGVLVSSSPSPFNPCYQGVDMGAKLGGRANHNQFFAGKMDDVWIFNRALTDIEVAAVFKYDGQLNFSLGNDTTLCGNQELVLDPDIEGATYFWSDSSTGSTLKINKPGPYWVRVNKYCVSKTDTIVVNWNGYGEINPEISVCPGDSGLFSVSNLKGTVSQWSFSASTANSVYVKDSGMVWVRVSQSSCHFYDTSFLNFSNCDVDLLTGLVGKYCLDGDGFDHSSNQNHGTLFNASPTTDRFGNPNAAISFSGNNSYMQMSGKGLFNKEYTYSFWYNVAQNPADGEARYMFNVGGGSCDQTVNISNNYFGVYNGINGGGYYDPSVGSTFGAEYSTLPPINQWNHVASVKTADSIKLFINGKLAASNPAPQDPCYQGVDLGAKLAGRANHNQYFAGKIDDAWIFDRALSDEEIAAIYNYAGTFNVDLGPDTSICGQSIMLDPAVEGATYVWSTGSTDSTLVVTAPGVYWVQVNKYCVNQTDTIVIYPGNSDKPLGKDTNICLGESIILDATVFNGSNYTWNTGANTPSISLTPDRDTLIVVNMNSGNCAASDSIYITVTSRPDLDIAKDTTFCAGEWDINLPQLPNVLYKLPDGSFTQSLKIVAEGIYPYQIISNTCTYDDSLEVTFITDPPVPSSVGALVCIGDSVSYDFDLSPYQAEYLWSNGSDTPFIRITSATNEVLTIITECSTYTRNVVVDYEDCHGIYIPNAFSINKDGLNDYFSIFMAKPKAFSIQIYDRWGEEIFSSEQYDFKWDGTYKGTPLPTGVYIYAVTIFTQTGKKVNRNGILSIFR